MVAGNTIFEKLIHGRLGRIEEYYMSREFELYLNEYETARAEWESGLSSEQAKGYESVCEAVRKMHIEEMQCAYAKGFCEGLRLGMMATMEGEITVRNLTEYLEWFRKKFE